MAQEVTLGEEFQIIQEHSSAALAYLGDSVFELGVRSRMVEIYKGNAGNLNKKSKALTNAKAQAQMAQCLKDILTEEELAVYKRGRNFKSPTVPRSCSVSEYRRATGLEALFGYLFICGRQERIDELIDTGIQAVSEGKINERQ